MHGVAISTARLGKPAGRSSLARGRPELCLSGNVRPLAREVSRLQTRRPSNWSMSLIQEISRVWQAGHRAPIRTVERDALLAARGDANILIVGERGPGKAALARFVHEQSDRSTQAFSIVKCSRLSDEMIRSQLFGHVDEGADEGSLGTSGLLTSASCGTVFLEDVGSLGAATQERLLRYLEATETDPDVRFVASTTVNLPAQVVAGLFLSDLYDRLSVRMLDMTP
jgi:DNA-binding NtrC family response regulator